MNTRTPSSSHFAQIGWNFGSAQFLAVDMGADRHAAQPELLHAVFELLDGKIGMLHGGGREGDKAVRMRRAQFGELLVLQSG